MHTQNVVSQRWTTETIPSSLRFDYWAHQLSTAVTPMRIERSREIKAFSAVLSATHLGPLSVVRSNGDGHTSIRGRAEIGRTSERCLHLLVSMTTGWTISHLGDHRMNPGDLILTDTRYPHEVSLQADHDLVNVKLPVDWAETWLPDISEHIGKRIPGTTGIAKALGLFMDRLTPEFLQETTVAAAAVADQVGGLLALASSHRATVRPALHKRLQTIYRHLYERCSDMELSAVTVATELGMSVEDLHRTLGAGQSTFALILQRARADVASCLMADPASHNLTNMELAHRAGFPSASKLMAALGKL